MHFLYIKRNGLYFVCLTKFNVAPAFVLELLSRYSLSLSLSLAYLYRLPYFHRIAGLCKDYCGILTEEAIRLNFALIYELLDEVLVSLSHTHAYSINDKVEKLAIWP